MLTLEGLHVGYGGLTVLHGVSMHVEAGELVAVVGPNGAGKTTLFNAISGVVPPQSGSIELDGADLTTVPAPRRAHLGVAHVPEGRQVFPSLTVLENLEMGAYARNDSAPWTDALERIYSFFPVLAERAGQAAGTLSGGEQQMLAIARGLASAPRLLMLDEPSMGLAPTIADEIFERIVAIHRETALSVLLETGRVVLEGDYATLKDDDRIRAAYLGM